MEHKQSGTDGTEQSNDGRANWLFPLFLGILLFAAVGVARWAAEPAVQQQASQTADWTPSRQPTGQTVGLTIDFGNGATKEFAALPWQPEMTVAQLLAVARDFQPGIDFTQKGSGAGGFLSSLDGLANEGASGRNWLYQVDGKHAHVSFCLEKIEPGMHILWTFTDELYNTEPVE